jgi:DNA-directed RNA polymerase subunit L
MSVDVESPDTDLISDVSIETDDEEVTPKLTAKEASQHTLEMRRKIEDRLERRRIKDQLGYDDISDLDF